MRTLLASVGLLALLVSAGASARDRESPDTTLNRLIEKGRLLLDDGDLEGALAAFEAAQEINLFEVPTYEPLVWIAQSRCQLGDHEGGLAVLADLDCILEVDSGEVACYVGWPTTAAPGQPNPQLTPRCYLEMCGEAYLSYYEHPTEATLLKIEDLRLRSSEVKTGCLDTKSEERR